MAAMNGIQDVADLTAEHADLAELVRILQGWDRVAVAFSGGVDSTFLLRVAAEALPGRVMAVTAISLLVGTKEIERAQEIAAVIGVPHLLVPTTEMDDPLFLQNTSEKCYYCKSTILSQLRDAAQARDFDTLVEGSNADDAQDWRPGKRALAEMDIPSPLLLAGLNKARIRELARCLGLPNWAKPSAPCLATRIPFGTPITMEALRRVAVVEEALATLGWFTVYRARAHGDLFRLEVLPEELPLAVEHREELVEIARKAGFRWVTLDLEGYRPIKP